MKKSPKTFLRFHQILLIVVLCLTASMFPLIVNGQADNPAAMKAKAIELMNAQKMTEALPLFEKLAVATPKDAEVRMYLGFSLLAQALNTTDAAERRQLRIRARDSFVMARDNGDNSTRTQGLIDGLPLDGSDAKGYSDNAAANKMMQQGEAAFSTGKLDDALTAYQAALKIDPRCYFAALFAGDVFKEKNNAADAEVWYQKAIAIDPYIETGYRYSATPLMKAGKYELARDRYVEAFIVDPYNRLAVSGIIGWGQVTKTQLGHPKIDVPEITIGPDGKSKSNVNVSPGMDDGSMAWISYVTTRESWQKEKFVKQFPREKAYRHTLREEAEALRSVVATAKDLKPKKLNEQIATLAKMDQDGVLEAFILIAMPDQGIAWDHRAYLLTHRDKLRQYVVSYVIGGSK